MSTKRICAMCVLPANYPGISFDSHGVCNFCKPPDPSNALEFQNEEEIERSRERNTRDFTETLERLRRLDIPHHVVVAYSGGKDSNYLYGLLTDEYGMRVKAVTVDMGFDSDVCLSNIQSMKRRIRDNLEVITIPREVTTRLYRRLVSGLSKGSRYIDSVCSVCHCLLLGAVVRYAHQQNVPLVLGGHSPDESNFVYELARDLIPKQMQMILKLDLLSKEDLRHFWSDVTDNKSLPRFLSPFHALPYSVEEVRAYLDKRNLIPIENSDAGVTNCKIVDLMTGIAVMNDDPVPYVAHMALQVRKGIAQRESALKTLEAIEKRSLQKETQAVAKELGIDLRAGE